MCTTRELPEPVPPAPLTAEEIAAREAETRKWESFCKPTRYQSGGIYRTRYAHEDCDIGRSE